MPLSTRFHKYGNVIPVTETHVGRGALPRAAAGSNLVDLVLSARARGPMARVAHEYLGKGRRAKAQGASPGKKNKYGNKGSPERAKQRL